MRNIFLFWKWVFLIVGSVPLLANAKKSTKLVNYTTPTVLLAESEYPDFVDDLDFLEMKIALNRQLKRFQRKNLNGTIILGGQSYPLAKIKDTLVEFGLLVDQFLQCKDKIENLDCVDKFNQQIRQNFYLFAPDLRTQNSFDYARFTAYYTPLIEAGREKSEQTPYAIYKKPVNNSLLRSTRNEIDFQGKLEGRGLELFFAPDLFELYILHVEGGGKILVGRNGTTQTHYLSFSGTNRQRWDFISKYMINKGMIDSHSIEEQRNFLKAHPEVQEEVFSSCPSYVYFKLTDTPPEGSDLVPLTDNRSIATDSNYYRFKGMLSFVRSKRLKEEDVNTPTNQIDESSFKSFSRFMLDQDTGGAIRGKARVDLYFGEGKYAGRASENQNHTGELYFLLVK